MSVSEPKCYKFIFKCRPKKMPDYCAEIDCPFLNETEFGYICNLPVKNKKNCDIKICVRER